MRNIRKSKKIALVVFAVLLLLVIFLSFITYNPAHFLSQNTILAFAVTNHVWIMVVMVLAAIFFGFLWSQTLYKEIESKQKSSQSAMDVIFLFLGREEKSIINFLVQKNGKTTQADISRLSGMNKVKAFRCLQKMQDKKLVNIQAHGKVRYIILKAEILDILKKEDNSGDSLQSE